MSYTFDIQVSRRATGQYTNFDFNSYCRFGDTYLSAKSDGIFELTGGTDDGTDIDAYFEPIMSDFGHHGFLRCRYLYTGGESDGDCYYKVKFDEQTFGTYTVDFQKASGQQTVRTAIGRDKYGRYCTIQFGNTDGADFSVDSMRGLFIPRAFGHKGY